MTPHRAEPTEALRTTAGAPPLELRSVRKCYPARDEGTPRVVLDDVDLVVDGGSSLGVIGGNGAGKSTLLKLIAGVTAPTAGRIRRPARTTSVIELGAAVHPDLTGRENVELLLRLHGVTGAGFRHSMDEVIEFSGLGDVIDRRARTYSTGMAARLAFSAAALVPTELLLLDEVLSVGDLTFQARCREQLEHCRRRGTTVVLVSHDLDLVATMCDRVVLLRSGRIALDGPASSVVRAYLGLAVGDGSSSARGPEVRCRSTRLLCGEPIDVHIGALPDGAGRVRLELVISEHPTFEALGMSESVVFATSVLENPVDGLDLRVDTSTLPPARYELAVTALDGAANGSTTTVPVVLSGPRPARFALQLDAKWSVRPLSGSPARRTEGVG